jgi:hypothetical protein
MVANSLTADQIAPQAVNQLMRSIGPGAMAADLGPNTQHLAGALASLPGEPQAIVRSAMASRAAASGDRLAGDVAQTLGTGTPVGALTDSIIAQQKAAADPLYASVRQQLVEMTPDLHFIQTTPTGSAAFAAAAKTMQDQGRGGTGMTVDFLDKVKQELDDVASSNYAQGKKNAGNNARDMARSLTAVVDAQVPQYAQARDAFAGPAKVIDAVKMGQEVFKSATSPEDLQSAMQGMSTSEKDGLLAGAQGAVQEMIGNARTDAQGVKQAFQSSNAKQKLGILLGPDAAGQISDALDREAQFARTNQLVAGNSETAARQAAQKMVNPDLAGVPKTPLPTWQALLFAGLEKARGALTSTYRATQNKALANMLTQGPLGADQLAAVARASKGATSRVPGAAVAVGAKNAGIGTGNPFLDWAPTPSEPQMVFRDGKWIPRIVVRGANVIGQ